MNISTKLLQAAAGSAGGGATTDVSDVFSTFLYDGNGATQVIENGIALGNANDGGSGEFNGTDQRIDISSATNLQIGSSDFTLEMFFFLKEAPVTYDVLAVKGFNSQNSREYGFEFDGSNGVYFLYSTNGTAWTLPTVVSSGVTVGVWHHIAVSRSGSNLSVWFDGTRTYNDASHAGTYHTGTDNLQIAGYNDGSANAYYPYAYYSNLRLVKGSVVYNPSSSSITVPTAALTNVTNTSLLTLQGDTPFVDNSSSSHTLTQNGSPVASDFGPFTGTNGEGGLVWFKRRDSSASNNLEDTVRGAGKNLVSNSNAAEDNQSGSYGISAFNSNGFSLVGNGNRTNASGGDYVSWTFRKQPKFFDIVTYTGSGNNVQTVSHNLGSDVGMIIVKSVNSDKVWHVWHKGLSNAAQSYIYLDYSDQANTATDIWGNTAPTSTQFTVGSNSDVNGSGITFVAYLFAHNNNDGGFGEPGDQDIIKCGSYTGTGSAGNSINLGFEPQWLLVKSATRSGQSWELVDTMRGFTSGSVDERLRPNATDAGESSFNVLEPTPTGFKTGSSVTDEVNESGQTYIYMAIRRGGMQTPTAATDVFALQQDDAGGTEPAFVSGFPVDAAFSKNAAGNAINFFGSRLTGANYLRTNDTTAEVSNSDFAWDYMNGWNSEPAQGSSVISYMWKRAPSYFDVVAYTGTGIYSVNTVSHNLGAVPEMIWTKKRSGTGDWVVYHKGLNGGTNPEQYITVINSTNAEQDRNYFNDTAPTATTFQVTDYLNSASPYISYLFATVANVSKVGSYTMQSGGIDVDCGFSAGARFILIKSTGSGRDWLVFDTTRGIVTGNDPYLRINLIDAEVTSQDLVDPLSSGFRIPESGVGNIANVGETYIFYAIA